MTDPEIKKPAGRWRSLLRRGRNGVAAETIAVRELSIVALIGAVIIGGAFMIAFHFVRPAPPSGFVISTGFEGGAYHLYAKRYRDLLAREKINVELRTSTGSAENLKRLLDPDSGVDVALIQGGIAPPDLEHGLVSLAALYYEPLWIFYRGDNALTRLTQLKGKRIAAGQAGSGTRALVINILEASGGLSPTVPLVPMGGTAAAEALIDGRLDAVLLVAGPEAPIVQKLLITPGIRLMNLSHAEALARHFNYLSTVTLPRGMIDIAADIPPTNIRMVATTATLIAREDFHPALIGALLQTVTKVNGGAGVFRKAGEFPVVREGDFPISEDAQRYFKSGPPFLQRYMPFWVANLIERLLVLIVPLIAVLIPVMRIMPALYDWRVKRKVFRWYRELKIVEVQARQKLDTADTDLLLKRLDEIEDGVDSTRVPLTYWDYVYTLRSHIDMVRMRLANNAAEPVALPPPPAAK